MVRVHGPFVDDREVEDVANFLRQQGEPDYNESVTEEDEAAAFDPSAAGAGQVPATGNSLYDEAVALVIREQKASTSFVQRYLKIGYNRAATLIEEMESAGIISAANHVGKERFLYRMKRTEPVICRLKLAVLALMASLVLPSHLVAQSLRRPS